ncbi:MAG: DUF1566 domain-containing protein [Deltaproteobacteria bacterium]|nr:DUF1566 domain-containing protein [Deltaproteobacteria bacterium]
MVRERLAKKVKATPYLAVLLFLVAAGASCDGLLFFEIVSCYDECAFGDDDDDNGPVGEELPFLDDDAASDDDAPSDEIWNDTSSGLMWQVPANAETLSWSDATAYCASLEWRGYTDWRLPSVSELRTVIVGCDATEPDGSCGVRDDCPDLDCTDDACGGCEGDECYLATPLDESCSMENSEYWSSSVVGDQPDSVWFVDFYFAAIDAELSGGDTRFFALCVRLNCADCR